MRYATKHCKQIAMPFGRIKFVGNCVVTGKPVEVTVTQMGIKKYASGLLIQDCFPELSPDDREFLISGMSKEGWDLAFGGEE